jgi:hypothetical protein
MGNLKMNIRILSKVLKGKKNLINLDAYISKLFKKNIWQAQLEGEEWI